MSGGNYTQPVYHRETERYTFVTYVNWQPVGEFDSWQEADQLLKKKMDEFNPSVRVEIQ